MLRSRSGPELHVCCSIFRVCGSRTGTRPLPLTKAFHHLNFLEKLFLNLFLRGKKHIFQVLNLNGFNLQHVLIDPMRNPVLVVFLRFFYSVERLFSDAICDPVRDVKVECHVVGVSGDAVMYL